MKNKIISTILFSFIVGCSSETEPNKIYNQVPELQNDFCFADQIALIPMFHNPPNAPDPLLSGLNVNEKFIEKDTFVCRKISADKMITIFRVTTSVSIIDVCTLKPQFFWSIAEPNQLTGFVWSSAIEFSELSQPLNIDLSTGKDFFGCLKLPIQNINNRACVMSCEDGYDPKSFWSDTDSVSGLVKIPIELESLSTSPNLKYAQEWKNDQRRVGIYFEWYSK